MGVRSSNELQRLDYMTEDQDSNLSNGYLVTCPIAPSFWWLSDSASAAVYHFVIDIEGLVQDCIISSASALEILQSCTKPMIHWCIGPKDMQLYYCVLKLNLFVLSHWYNSCFNDWCSCGFWFNTCFSLCARYPEEINSMWPNDAIWCYMTLSSLAQTTICHLFGI